MTRVRRVVLSLTALGVAFVMTVGFAYGVYQYSGRGQVKSFDHGLQAIVGGRVDAQLMMAVFGPVTKVGNCFGFGGDLASWPYGTEVLAGDRLKIHGRVYRIGDQVELGGGVLELSSHDFDPEDLDLPDGCGVTESFYVLN